MLLKQTYSFPSSHFVFSLFHLWQFRQSNKLIRCLFCKRKATSRCPMTQKRKIKGLQKGNTTCKSHSATISAQRCSASTRSSTARSPLLPAQDIPTDTAPSPRRRRAEARARGLPLAFQGCPLCLPGGGGEAAGAAGRGWRHSHPHCRGHGDGDLHTGPLIWKTHPSLTGATGAWN